MSNKTAQEVDAQAIDLVDEVEVDMDIDDECV